jgi:4-amino-4-deoxy-L-arabinose transferase-like glycosyltransferase
MRMPTLISADLRPAEVGEDQKDRTDDAEPRSDLGADEPEGQAKPAPWVRIALLVLLAATAGAYLYNLAASGYGNDFYAAAVEAGAKSWKAMFFGSLDPSNFITVDKPPAALWVMELSARIFGFNTWSVMVPNVLEGVAAVGLLFGAVRRVAGPAAGLLAGAILAVTPVAALMFRFDNPDAMLVLLLVAAAYFLTCALERAKTGWLLLAGSFVGLAFLAKMGQALIVVPAFGLAYLIAAPTGLRRRIGQLTAALAAMIVASGWWVAIVALTPAVDRPFIDGSPDNSILNLIFGYNGLERLSGNGGGANFSGSAGLLRLFNQAMGGQASWLIPLALVAMVAVVAARWRSGRCDRPRAAAILWGGWLLVTAAVFSFSRGTIHTYYTVALTPAIAALVAIGAQQLWFRREQLWARALGAVAVLGTSVWAWVLLDRTPSWFPWLRWAIVVAGALGALGLSAAPLLLRSRRRVGLALAALVAVGCLSGPVAYSGATIDSGHTGSIPSAGPTSAQTLGGFGGGGSTPGAGGFGPGRGGFTPRQSGQAPGSQGSGNNPPGGFPSGQAGSGQRRPATGGTGLGRGGSTTAGGGLGQGARSRGFRGGFGAGTPGAGGGFTTSSALVKALEAGASKYRWVAAVEGSQSAASLELASDGDAVMAIGGFSGLGGNLSLAAFQDYVAQGEIHYYIGGSSAGPGRSSSGSTISTWVASHFHSVTIGGETVYDLTSKTQKS